VQATNQSPVANQATYRDRHHAGVVLARELSCYAGHHSLVIAIPHGGVPVGAAVAQALRAELDIMVVHKLGVPGHPHIAAGALTSSGAANINHRAMGSFGVSPVALERALEKERIVLEQHERELRSGRPAKSVTGRTVIVVDDGIATGTTLRTALTALRARGASKLVVAVPVAAAQTLEALRQEADEIVCPSIAAPFFTIGQSYEDFSPVSAAFAKRLLDDHDTAAESARRNASLVAHELLLRLGDVRIAGTLTIPDGARGIVIFLHGSGSNRFSPRNTFIARTLERAGFATLLVDLLTAEEQAEDAEAHELGNDISLLGRRAIAILDWVYLNADLSKLPLALFGSSSGAAAAMIAAAERPKQVLGIVSRGGRPDLAEQALPKVAAKTLLIVGSNDHAVLELNRAAALRLRAPHRLELIADATHLFTEPDSLERVSELSLGFLGEVLPKQLSQ
jgi:putative phosphoribosyl transferase